MDREARALSLPTYDELDQSCFLLREMFDVSLQDEDLFIRDTKKGT